MTETKRKGGHVESGHASTAAPPVLAAGLGVRVPGGWALRLASFRLDWSPVGKAALGIATPRSAASSGLIDVLAGRARPAYGSLRVLGYDMSTASGRAVVRGQVGTASRTARAMPAIRIRRMVERAARHCAPPGSDAGLLVAAILDRLALMPWAEVALGAAPELIVRKARLAAACVHQPNLLLVDGLLDHLPPLDRTVLADTIRDIERDTAVVAVGLDPATLSLVCDQVITLADGILVGGSTPAEGAAELSRSELVGPG